MAATLLFLVPLCVQMVRKMDTTNFCSYMALCNLIAFNFGFHVHEKAMLLVTIPLGIDLVIRTNNNTSILRFKILKFVLMWTLLPLIFTPRETFLKHSLFVLDVLVTDAILPTKTEDNHFWAKAYKWVYGLVKVMVFVIQVAQIGLLELKTRESAQKEYLMYRYTDLLPILSALVN